MILNFIRSTINEKGADTPKQEQELPKIENSKRKV